MADLAGVTATWSAAQGNIEPLLERLRRCDLAKEEKDWIEARLRGKPASGGKLKRGPKPSARIAARNQAILRFDAWLRYVQGWRKKDARLCKLKSELKKTGLTESQLRSILRSTPDLMTKLSIAYYKENGFFMRAGVGDASMFPKPVITDTD